MYVGSTLGRIRYTVRVLCDYARYGSTRASKFSRVSTRQRARDARVVRRTQRQISLGRRALVGQWVKSCSFVRRNYKRWLSLTFRDLANF